MNADLTVVALLLADTDWGHMDGWWVVMGVGMIVAWALVILGIVWVVRELTGRDGWRQAPLELLDRRLAEGEISPADYRERRAILTGSPPRQAEDDS